MSPYLMILLVSMRPQRRCNAKACQAFWSEIQSPVSWLGLLRERDIIYRAVAKSLGMFKVNIGKIMSTPLITVDKETPCIEAIKIMREKRLRRLPIMDHGNILGVATLMSIVGNMPTRNVELIELEKPPTSQSPDLNCPYCESKFVDKMEL